MKALGGFILPALIAGFTFALLWPVAPIGIEAAVAIGLSDLVLYLFADNLVHSAAFYFRHRNLRRLRAFVLALLLAAGSAGILMGTVARYVPELGDPARFIRWVTIGMLFVGGAMSWVTWRFGNDGEE